MRTSINVRSGERRGEERRDSLRMRTQIVQIVSRDKHNRGVGTLLNELPPTSQLKVEIKQKKIIKTQLISTALFALIRRLGENLSFLFTR